MNSEMQVPPTVVGGCFDTRGHRMWLIFQDETAHFYPKVPLTVLKKLQSFETPSEAQDYMNTHVLGVIDSRPVDYMAFCISSALGMEPPTN